MEIVIRTVSRCVMVTLLALSMFGCGKVERNEVVVYTSLDRPHSAPIFAEFTAKTGISVEAVFDTEASKTVGLFHRLLAERSNPQADVFWNSEVTRTIRLQEEQLLAPYRSASAEEIPKEWKDADGYWAGFGLRGRVILQGEGISIGQGASIRSLVDSKWKGKAALANPLFGTANTHFATLLTEYGEKWLMDLCDSLAGNGVVVMTGNAQARDAVSAGEVPFCFTDTDDARGAIENGRPVSMLFPDYGEPGSGVLLIPNTVSIMKGGPNRANAEKFVDFLLSEEVEEMLAHSSTAQIPVRDSVARPQHVPMLSELDYAKLDFHAISSEAVLERVSEIVKARLLE